MVPARHLSPQVALEIISPDTFKARYLRVVQQQGALSPVGLQVPCQQPGLHAVPPRNCAVLQIGRLATLWLWECQSIHTPLADGGGAGRGGRDAPLRRPARCAGRRRLRFSAGASVAASGPRATACPSVRGTARRPGSAGRGLSRRPAGGHAASRGGRGRLGSGSSNACTGDHCSGRCGRQRRSRRRQRGGSAPPRSWFRSRQAGGRWRAARGSRREQWRVGQPGTGAGGAAGRA